MMFTEDDDTAGGAFRLGYGITDALDIEAKAAFFGGLTFVGGDVHWNIIPGDTSLSASVGGHRAMWKDAPSSNALDLAVQVGQRFGRRVELYGGSEFSYESISGAQDGNFTRWYVVPGLKVGIAEKLDLLVEGGVGLNDDSPHFVTAGLALHLPVSASARGRRR
jgi:hypothetical protein